MEWLLEAVVNESFLEDFRPCGVGKNLPLAGAVKASKVRANNAIEKRR